MTLQYISLGAMGHIQLNLLIISVFNLECDTIKNEINKVNRIYKYLTIDT